MPTDIYKESALVDRWPPGKYEGTAAYYDKDKAWIKEEAKKLKWWSQEAEPKD